MVQWSKLPYPGDNAVALAVSPARLNGLLTITFKAISRTESEGLVYRSEDGGATWGGKR